MGGVKVILNGFPYLHDASLATPAQWKFILDTTLRWGLREGQGVLGEFWQVPNDDFARIQRVVDESRVIYLPSDLDSLFENVRKICSILFCEAINEHAALIASQCYNLQTDHYSLLLMVDDGRTV